MTEYCICSIGVKIANKENESVDEIFNLNGNKYKLLHDININKLKNDLKRTPQFTLKPVTNHWEIDEYICLFFNPNNYTTSSQSISLNRIINQFFNIPSTSIPITVNLSALNGTIEESNKTLNDSNNSKNISNISDSSISNLYTLLREAHLNDNISDNIPREITCSSLKPTLRQYQINGVRWMLHRELVSDTLPSEYFQISCPTLANVPFYFNRRILDIMDRYPGNILIPSGGILADEMGLGKTVEMLALILLNKKRKRKLPVEFVGEVKVSVKNEKIQIKCLCTKCSTKNLIKCTKCLFYQHRKCVKQIETDLATNSQYICPECWQYEPLIESSATFIVSPPSIKMQWQEEVIKHISDPCFKVLIYDGIKQIGWINPIKLAEYDIVLTDYNILRSEIYFSATNKRSSDLRNKPKFINPTSPLTMVHWWRVCLDEAQMVETPQSNCSLMVRTLSTVHRWAITGTPIEKTIDNLYGLMVFLGCTPYDELIEWKKLTDAFQNDNSSPLIDVLRKIMWRTCKSNVLKELGIPPQEEIIHNVTMYDLQAFFYTEQHNQCAAAFREKARKLGKTLSMFKMNTHTLNLIMEPLRKLRQDCTVPTIFHRNDQSTTKKVLNSDELLKHLLSNNEIECKSELRTVASSLNGIAALYIIKGEFEMAEKMYREVLRWAKDYTETICVDSLLQIHALHNLFEVMELQGKSDYSECEDHKKEYKRLEMKYIETSSKLIKEATEKQIAVAESIKKLEIKLNDKKCNWWLDIIHEIQDTPNDRNLMNKIIDEIRVNYSSSAFENLTSLREVAYILVTWLDQISNERKNLQNWFKKLEFFSENVKPREQLDPNTTELIENLIKTAFECHLDPDLAEKEKKNKKKKRRIICLLCQTKEVLKKYECEVFDKIFNDTADNTGTWNPKMEEVLLKIIFSQAKKDKIDQDLLQDGEIHLQMIELLKKEFKEYSQRWVEINYAASAYDELNMCKSRLQVVDPEQVKDEPESRLNISIYEIDERMQEYGDQLQEGKLKFIRLQGTLKYLKHLQRKSEPDVCPICKQEPEGKYSMLECGHHMCMVCVTHMTKFYKTYLMCCVCRNRQKFNNIYYVTCTPKVSSDVDQSIQYRGDYPKKIEEIVRTVLQLRQKDEDVKIIIFSHWDTVLNVIGDALEENSITYRLKSVKFFKSIEEFKDTNLNVTCLLLRLAHGSKGLNLIEATHVFLVEPILNPAEELQAIGRIHRIGQTRPTFVHRFIVLNTIEETIWRTISNDKTGKWKTKEITVEELQELFTLNANNDKSIEGQVLSI